MRVTGVHEWSGCALPAPNRDPHDLPSTPAGPRPHHPRHRRAGRRHAGRAGSCRGQGSSDEEPALGARRLRALPGADDLRPAAAARRGGLRQADDDALRDGLGLAHRSHLRQRPLRALRRPRVGLDAQRQQHLAGRRRAVGAGLADGPRQERRAGCDGPALRDHVHHPQPQDVALLRARARAGRPTTAPHRTPTTSTSASTTTAPQGARRGGPASPRRRSSRPCRLPARRCRPPRRRRRPPPPRPRCRPPRGAVPRDDLCGGEDAADAARRAAGDGLLRHPHQGARHRLPEVRRPAADGRRRPAHAGDPRPPRVAHGRRRLPDAAHGHDLDGGQDAADQARQPADDRLLRLPHGGAGHGLPEVRRPAADRGRRPRHAGPALGARLVRRRCRRQPRPTRPCVSA